MQMIELDNIWHQKTFDAVLTDLQRRWDKQIYEQKDVSMYCIGNSEIDNKMDGVEGIDLYSVSKTKKGERWKGKENTKQESQDKMKTNTIIRMKDKNMPEKAKSTAESRGN